MPSAGLYRLGCSQLRKLKLDDFQCLVFLYHIYNLCMYVYIYILYIRTIYMAYYKLDRLLFFGCKYLRSGPQEFGFP